MMFFVSPIIYPSEAVPERLRDLYQLNPLVAIIEGFRWSFLQMGEAPDLNVSSPFAICLFVISGIWAFRRVEQYSPS